MGSYRRPRDYRAIKVPTITLVISTAAASRTATAATTIKTFLMPKIIIITVI